MNGTGSGTVDRFRTAFESMNGRPPTIEETKDALRYAQVVEQSGLDPFLLAFIADIHNREQRAKLPGEISEAIAGGIVEMRKAIPSGHEMRDRLREVSVFAASMDRAAQAMTALTAFLRVQVLPIAIITAVLVILVLLVGYKFGYSQRSTKTACEVLQNVADLARQQRHGQTASDVRAAAAARFCGT